MILFFILRLENHFHETMRISNQIDEDNDIVPSTSDEEDEINSPNMNDVGKTTKQVKSKPIESNIKVNSVPKLNVNKKKKRDRKKDSCFYCQRLNSNIHRHLITCHKNENYVIEALKTRSRSHARKKAIEKIRLHGNFEYNLKVLREGKGNLLVVRRPNYEVSYKEYAPCIHCLGFFQKRELYKHLNTCCHKKENTQYKATLKDCKLLILPAQSLPSSEEFESNVLVRMQNDDISNIIRNDQILLQFGKYLLSKLGNKQYSFITQKLRLLGRLLQKFKNENENLELIDLISPPYFDEIVNKTLAIIGQNKNKKGQSIGLKMGHCINKLAVLTKSWALKTKDNEKYKSASAFIEIFSTEWSDRISSHCLRMLYDQKLEKKEMLPLTSDLVKISKYLDKAIDNYITHNNEQMLNLSAKDGRVSAN